MKGDFASLYSKVIRAHNEAPYHFEKRTDSTSTVNAYNPICGDRFELYLDQHGQNINHAYFHGFGCAISKASTSLLIELIEGKTVDEAKGICHRFLQFINKELPVDTANLSNDFLAFAGVHDFPERYDCATISWKALKIFLEKEIK